MRWFIGPARSGKSESIVAEYVQWIDAGVDSRQIAVFAATGELRSRLARRLYEATDNRAIIQTFTPIGFFQKEVLLYWPLLQVELGLVARFPLEIGPENEQEIAARLFDRRLRGDGSNQGVFGQQVEGIQRDRIVRHIIDNLQIAAAGLIPAEEIGDRFLAARPSGSAVSIEMLKLVGDLAVEYRSALLGQGLLSYSLSTELYGQELLKQQLYRQQLRQRFTHVVADDADEYPALMAEVMEVWRQTDVETVVTFSPEGSVRLGYGADPEAILAVQGAEDEVVELESGQGLEAELRGIEAVLADPAEAWGAIAEPLERLQTIQRSTRRELLRAVAEDIIEAVQLGVVTAKEIAIIGPGLDPVGVYTLRTLLEGAEIPVRLLDNSRPLWGSPLVRALMTLVALVYPDCGHLLMPEGIAEMLTVTTAGAVDPVRAGLLSDRCFQAHPHHPEMLPSTTDSRRDRLGAVASAAYDRLVTWVVGQKQSAEHLPSLPEFLQRCIREFGSEQELGVDRVAAYRALIESAQRYEEVMGRLGQPPEMAIAAQFYQVLAGGAVTSKPNLSDLEAEGLVLGTSYQYRLGREGHRWQYWLDAGSSLWNSAFSSFGSFQLKNPYLFLRAWEGGVWTAEQTQVVLDEQLGRVLADVLHRCGERVVLCHSELSIAGNEMDGPLMGALDRATVIAES